MLSGVQSQEMFQNILQVEIDKLKKQAKENVREQQEKIEKKNKIINELLTESENTKTALSTMEQTMSIKKAVE
jgi:glutamyl-tRNA reductase